MKKELYQIVLIGVEGYPIDILEKINPSIEDVYIIELENCVIIYLLSHLDIQELSMYFINMAFSISTVTQEKFSFNSKKGTKIIKKMLSRNHNVETETVDLRFLKGKLQQAIDDENYELAQKLNKIIKEKENTNN